MPLNVFRRHVGVGPDRQPATREVRCIRIAGNAKIAQHRLAYQAAVEERLARMTARQEQEKAKEHAHDQTALLETEEPEVDLAALASAIAAEEFANLEAVLKSDGEVPF